MKAFTRTGAKHFVKSFGATKSASGESVEDYLLAHASQAFFAEGTTEFDELRDCILREADRSILLAVNCFARALDGLRASSAYWTLVGLYYSSFFSAKAVLGMYGCWMSRPKMWIEVVDANPRQQKLAYRKKAYGGGGGSHRVTWTAFYAAMSSLKSWQTKPYAVLAMSPVGSIDTWLIDARNEVNYDPDKAFKLKQEFDANFDPKQLPGCFGGKLRTMFDVAHASMLLARDMAADLILETDIYAPEISRKDWSRNLITSPQDPALLALATSYYAQINF